MADDTLNLVVKLTGDFKKLEKLKESGLNIKANLNLAGDFNKLTKIKESGLDIKVNVKLGGDFQKLLNLQQQGITIKTTPSISPGRGAAGRAGAQSSLARFMEQEQIRLEQAAENVEARRQQRIQQFTNRQRTQAIFARRSQLANQRLQQLNFRQGFQLQEAQEEFARGPAFGDTEQARRQIAFRRGILPEQITSQRRLIDLNRLRNPEVIREIAFAGLFGQGLLGKVTNIAGGVVGGAIGGPGGALLGSTVAQVGLDTARDAFDKVAGALKEASDAAQQFERSIIGTAGALQATTQIVGPGGQPVPERTALREQLRRAEVIQRGARGVLLPLGIAGEREANLVQAFVQARASQGFEVTPEISQKILPRLGAFAQTTAPGLDPTRLFRDVLDILVQSPQARRTVIGAPLASVAPALFRGKPLSNEELDKATQILEEYVSSIKNSNLFLTERLKLEGQFQLLQVDVGEALNNALIPGLKALQEILSDPAINEGLQLLAKQIGEIAAGAIKGIAEVGPRVVGTALTAGKGIGGIAELAAKGIGGILENVIPGSKGLTDIILNTISITGKTGQPGIKSEIGIPRLEEIPGLGAIQRPETAITSLLQQLGLGERGFEKFTDTTEDILSKSGDAQIAAGQLIFDKLGEIGDQLPRSKVIETQTGALNLIQEGLAKQQKQLEMTFDPFFFQEAIGKAKFNVDNLGQQIAVQQAKVATKQKGLEELVPGTTEYSLRLAELRDETTKIIALEKQRGVAEREILNQSLELTQAQRQLRNSFENIQEALKDEVFQRKALNKSLEESQAKLREFPEALEAAISGKEQGILGAAKQVQELGGVVPPALQAILESPEQTRAFQLKAATAQLNELLTSVGEQGVIDISGAPDLFSRQGEGSFQIGLKNQQEALADSITKINDEFTKLERSVRNAIESFDDLNRTLRPRLRGFDTPTGDQPIFAPPAVRDISTTVPTLNPILGAAEGETSQGISQQESFTKQVVGSPSSSTNQDITNILKELPRQFGYHMRVAIENAFSGS